MKNASIILEEGMYLKFEDTVKKLLDDYCSVIKFKKESIILLQGDRATDLYFLIQGIVRGYYIDEDGNDITKCFASENEFFSTEGLRTQQPSSFTIECLEDCECVRIPYHIMQLILDENEALLKVFNQYIIRIMNSLEDRTRDLVMKSAKERYRIFIKQYPRLEHRINQKYIASYIGIRAGSLSRIKKQAKFNKN